MYRAAEPARSLAARAVRQIIDRFSKGSVEDLVSGMVEGKMLSKAEMDRLEEFVRDDRKGEQMRCNAWRWNSRIRARTYRRRGREPCCAVLRIRARRRATCRLGGRARQRCCCSPSWIAWGPKASLPVLPARGEAAVVMRAAPVSLVDPATPLRSPRLPRPSSQSGSPTLSEGKYPQTRQTKPRMGAAVVDRLYKPGWQNRTETRICHSRARNEHDSTAGSKSCRRASSPAKSREGDTLLRDFIPGVRGQVFCPELLSHTETFNAATLSPHTRTNIFYLLLEILVFAISEH